MSALVAFAYKGTRVGMVAALAYYLDKECEEYVKAFGAELPNWIPMAVAFLVSEVIDTIREHFGDVIARLIMSISVLAWSIMMAYFAVERFSSSGLSAELEWGLIAATILPLLVFDRWAVSEIWKRREADSRSPRVAAALQEI
jgi:hypothetical protein